MERLHKRVKRDLLGRLHTRSYERGVIEDVTLEHLRRLQEPWNMAGLCAATGATEDIAELVRSKFPTAVRITTAVSSRTRFGLEFYRGDVVLYGKGFAGRVWYKTPYHLQHLENP